MKKRNKEGEYFKITKFRWEFLRRNKKYQSDYRKWNKFPLTYWRKQYDISFPCNPAHDIYQLRKRQKKELFFDENISPPKAVILNDVRSEPIGDEDRNREEDVVNSWLREEGRDKIHAVSVLNLLVDITRRERLILTEFRNLIYDWKKIRKTEHRNHFEEYKRYLSVYDLSENGWSPEKLAHKFYTGDAGGINYAKRKVKRDYDRCKKLIDGGYRQIM